jgi:hypothetical protein
MKDATSRDHDQGRDQASRRGKAHRGEQHVHHGGTDPEADERDDDPHS